MPLKNRYAQVIERVFFTHFTDGAMEVEFQRQEFEAAARDLGIRLPKNLGDIIYSFRYRTALPKTVQAKAPHDMIWIIRPAGRGRYRFVAVTPTAIVPNPLLAETKVPDATPGIINMYATGDEQALLAKLRYNRLVDLFTAVTCYSLQSHLRTTLPNGAQVETDEIYVGIDRRGAQYVFPVQAKGRAETLGIIQIEQDFALCASKFSALICRPIGAQFMAPDLIALFEFEETATGIAISSERHYRLVAPDDINQSDLATYRGRPL